MYNENLKSTQKTFFTWLDSHSKTRANELTQDVCAIVRWLACLLVRALT